MIREPLRSCAIALPVASACAVSLVALRDARAQDPFTQYAPQDSPPRPASPPPSAERAPATFVDAPADGMAPVPTVEFEIAAKGLFTSNPIRGATTPMGLGGGGRLGLVIHHVYFGATVVAYRGGSDDAGTSERMVMYGLEAGYGIRVSERVTLRPLVGFGSTSVAHTIANPPIDPNHPPPPDVVTSASGSSGSTSSPFSTTSVNALYLEPSFTAFYIFPTRTFVGVTASALYLPSVSIESGSSVTWLSYGMGLQLGQRF